MIDRQQAHKKITNPRIITGKVVSAKMHKTIVVLIERTVTHPKYKKIMRLRSKVYAHDENETCKIGDMVIVRESRPISKTKNWVLIEKIV